jgi:hypothetical protein
VKKDKIVKMDMAPMDIEGDLRPVQPSFPKQTVINEEQIKPSLPEQTVLNEEPSLPDREILSEDEESPSVETEGKSYNFSEDEKSALARFVTGASPALMGLLSGASPTAQEMNYASTKSYYAGTTPKKLVMTVGENGEPIYTESKYATGKQAYVKPLAASATGMAAGKHIQKAIDPVTHKDIWVVADALNRTVSPMTYTGNEPGQRSEVMHPKTTRIMEGKDGTKSSVVSDVYGKTTKSGTLDVGRGVKYNLAEKDVDYGNKVASDILTKTTPMKATRSNIQSAESLLSGPSTSDNSLVKAAGMFRGAKIIVNEKISDDEKDYVLSVPGLFQKLSNDIATGLTGAQRENVIGQMKQILSKLKVVTDKSIAMTEDDQMQAYHQGEPEKRKYIEDKILGKRSGGISRESSINSSQVDNNGYHTKQTLQGSGLKGNIARKQKILDDLRKANAGK